MSINSITILQGKHKSHAFGQDVYFLGRDKDGIHYWLEEAKWACGWYWGGGYVENYTNDTRPAFSKDILCHQHFDGMFLNGNKCAFDMFKEFFVYTPFTDKEIWTICELMKAFYIARKYSDMLFCGGAHFSSNPSSEVIKNEKEYNRINKIVIPDLMNNLYKILGGG
jgi:hypothetical protein